MELQDRDDEIFSISLEEPQISLEMVLYDVYFRTKGIRRFPQLASPIFNDMSLIELPRNAIYHYNPESPLLYGPLENNVWYKNDKSLRFIEHITKFSIEPIGTIVKKPANEQAYVNAYRRKHRTLRLLRDFFGVNKQPQMLLVYNYCLLNQLWKYRPHRFVNYYHFYNLYNTILNNINRLGNVSERQQFFEIRLPKNLPSRQQFTSMSKEYPRGMSIRILSTFPDDDALLLFHLWMWLGNHRQYSIFNQLDQKNLSKINITLTDSGKYVLLNLGKLDEWRATEQENIDAGEFDEVDTLDDTDGTVDKLATAEMLLIKFYRLLSIFFSNRTGIVSAPVEVPTYTEAELNDETPVEEDNDTVEPVQPINPTDPVPEPEKKLNKGKLQQELEKLKGNTPTTPDNSKVGRLDRIKPLPGTEPKVEETSTLAGEPLPEPEINEEPKPQTLVVDDFDLDEDYEVPTDKRLPESSMESGVMEDAYTLLDAGEITAKEFQRIEKQSKRYKEIPSPYDDNQTLEQYMQVDPEVVNNFEKIKVPDSDWILDKSMLEASTEAFDRVYLKKVYSKNIMQAVTSIQKAGILVTDVQREEHRDTVNHYETLKVTVQPIGGTQTTMNIKLPVVDEEGTMLVAGTRYKLLKQRRDLPIRKVNEYKVSLTSFYGKMGVEKTERKSFNLEKYLLTSIQAKIIDGDIQSPVYGNAFDQKATVHPIYSYISYRFKNFTYLTKDKINWACNFELANRASYFNLKEDQLTKLEQEHQGVLFAQNHTTKTYAFINHQTGMITLSNNQEPTTIDQFFSFDKEPPVEIAEMKVFSKPIPMAIILGYYLGLTTLCRVLKVKPRKFFRGQRIDLKPYEYVIKFADETWVFDKRNYHASLILNGLNNYKRYLGDYSVQQFESPDVYMVLLRDSGVSMSFENEFKLMKRMFIDDITKDLLKQMNEPTEFIPLLIRAVELLTTTQTNDEINMDDMMITGYQRISGHIYRELVRNIKENNAKRTHKKERFDMPPNHIFQTIMKDPSVILIDDINPIHNLKEHENVTFGGDGGRSRRSMVGRTRSYHKSDLGVISEATVDNQSVAITTFLSANAGLQSLYGRAKGDVKGSANLFSTTGNYQVAGDTDDQQ